MSHKIEQAYRNIKPPAALITATLENVKRQRFRQNVTLLALQCCIYAVVCTVLAFALQSPAVGIGLFVMLCVVSAVRFYSKSSLYLNEKYMPTNEARLTAASLEAVVGGAEDENNAIKEIIPHCPHCGFEILSSDETGLCPICGKQVQ